MNVSILLNAVMSLPACFVHPLHQQTGFEFTLSEFAGFFIQLMACWAEEVDLECH